MMTVAMTGANTGTAMPTPGTGVAIEWMMAAMMAVAIAALTQRS